MVVCMWTGAPPVRPRQNLKERSPLPSPIADFKRVTSCNWDLASAGDIKLQGPVAHPAYFST